MVVKRRKDVESNKFTKDMFIKCKQVINSIWLECFFYTENVSGSNPLLPTKV